jgi:hypothetical protein
VCLDVSAYVLEEFGQDALEDEPGLFEIPHDLFVEDDVLEDQGTDFGQLCGNGQLVEQVHDAVEAHGRDGLELGLEVVGHLDQQLGEVLGVLVAVVQHQVQLLLQLPGTLVRHEEPVEEPVQVEQVVQRLLELLEARFQHPPGLEPLLQHVS